MLYECSTTVRNIRGTLHKAMEQAAKLGYIKFNPAAACTLPRFVKKEMKAPEDDQVLEFLKCIEGDEFEVLYYVDLFTGMRQGKMLGLVWSARTLPEAPELRFHHLRHSNPVI